MRYHRLAMAVTLTELSFENYKAFRARECIEVRPLTVFIGRNSSGKSSVVRLPILLGRSLEPRPRAPLVFDGENVDFGASFRDVVYNRNERLPIGVGVSWLDEEGGRVSLDVKVQFFSEDDVRMQVITEFVLTKGGTTIASWRWNDDGDPKSGLVYDDALRPGQVVCARFRGFYPYDVPSWYGGIEHVLRVQGAMGSLISLGEMLRGAVYLGPFRKVPEREYRFPEDHVYEVGPHGALAPQALVSDAVRGGRSIVDDVGRWYQRHLGGFSLDVKTVGSGASLVLKHPSEPGVDVNLLDTGVGLHQVLPVIVQRYLAATGHGAGLEITEQPELHLHPGAHGDLADLYIDGIKKSGTRFLVETHSDNFVLRLRRRIAEGLLQKTDVALYWVDDDLNAPQKVRRIDIDERGEVDFWPHGVFTEGLGELRAIRVAQRGARS